MSFGADFRDTSKFMVGHVTVTIVWLECDGQIDRAAES